MKVAMKIRIAGSRNGVRWPEAGAVVDLPGNEAVDLIAQGLAEAHVSREPEKATVAAPEKRAAAKKRRG